MLFMNISFMYVFIIVINCYYHFIVMGVMVYTP